MNQLPCRRHCVVDDRCILCGIDIEQTYGPHPHGGIIHVHHYRGPHDHRPEDGHTHG